MVLFKIICLKMIRLCRIGASKSVRNLISARRCSTLTNSYEEDEPETNFVKLIGTAWDNSSRLPSGGLSCKVVQRCKTDTGQQFSISHMVNIPQKVQKLCGIESLARGQKFNINGYVRSIPFTTFNGKTRKAIAVIPHDIEIYKSDEEPIQDICVVMMTASIESRIFNHGNIMAFNLRTHVPVRNKETGFTGRNIEHSHSVIATDPDLQHYIRTNLNQYDKVFVEGYLNYQQAQTDDGTRMSGNIIAVNIEKT